MFFRTNFRREELTDLATDGAAVVVPGAGGAAAGGDDDEDAVGALDLREIFVSLSALGF